MNKLFFFFVAVYAASTAAYDFKDSDFNEVILRDILELSDDTDSSLLHRVARAADRPTEDRCQGRNKDRGSRCCNDKIDYKQLEVLKILKKGCLAELHGNDSDTYFKFDPFTCDKLEELKKDVTCIAECVGRKVGVLDEFGNIRRDDFLAHLKMKFSDSLWKLKAADGIVDKCIDEANKEVAMHIVKREIVTEKMCNPTALKVSQCMWREYVRACPKDLRIDTPKCKKLREKIENGDAVTYKGFYLRHLNDDK